MKWTKKKKKALDTSASAQYIRALFACLLSVIGMKNEKPRNQRIELDRLNDIATSYKLGKH